MSSNRYHEEIFISTPIGPNATDFEKRKEWWSDCILRIPPMIIWTLDDVRLSERGYAYEMLDDRLPWGIRRERWLENLIEIKDSWSATCLPAGKVRNQVIYIIDNHHHAFYCRYKAYHDDILPRWSHLIHIDQHSDLSPLREVYPVSTAGGGRGDHVNKSSSLQQVANYTNTILDIGSFILPALDSGIISDQIQVRSEYALSQFSTAFDNLEPLWTIIVNIDLDFRAPEMSIEHYDQSITKVRQLINSPQVKCTTIATSPAFIDQERALKVLRDIIS